MTGYAIAICDSVERRNRSERLCGAQESQFEIKQLEFYFIAIGYNLYKFYNKQKKYYKLNKNKKEGYDI